jgi:hypothetical protein
MPYSVGRNAFRVRTPFFGFAVGPGSIRAADTALTFAADVI